MHFCFLFVLGLARRFRALQEIRLRNLTIAISTANVTEWKFLKRRDCKLCIPLLYRACCLEVLCRNLIHSFLQTALFRNFWSIYSACFTPVMASYGSANDNSSFVKSTSAAKLNDHGGAHYCLVATRCSIGCLQKNLLHSPILVGR